MPQKMTAAQRKTKQILGEFKRGTLQSGKPGPGKGPKVKSRSQAIAIALSMAGKSKKRK
jgi:hypothetical protein